MKVVYHKEFRKVYTGDPAAERGRMESILEVIEGQVTLVEPKPAAAEQIALAHDPFHIEQVTRAGLYEISALAAGGAIKAARIGLDEPAFACIRPPGHHASRNGAWGFCFFNNMAIALLALKGEGLIERALVLDIDLHFGDGTVNILGGVDWVHILNPDANRRKQYLEEISVTLEENPADLIGISAGFDNHCKDWGNLLQTEDYQAIGRMVHHATHTRGGGCFAILEGGYNHRILGYNVLSLINGLSGR
ncbi:MAG: histone deacetylase family protein [Bradymonadales bacterium]|nr:histone deacetylase family protein [Bradymonadales bacterium]